MFYEGVDGLICLSAPGVQHAILINYMVYFINQ